jgi:hypothetical protein
MNPGIGSFLNFDFLEYWNVYPKVDVGDAIWF